MDEIKNRIKEELKYEIKKSSQDILKEYNLRMQASSKKKAFRFNFRFMYATLGLSLAAITLVLGVKLNSNNPGGKLDKNPNSLNVDEKNPNLKKLDLTSEQQIEYQGIANEMTSVISYMALNGNITTSNITDGNVAEDVFKNRYDIVKNIINESQTKLNVYQTNYTTITSDGKENTFEYMMYFENGVEFFFDSALTNSTSLKGVIKTENEEYRVTGKTNQAEDGITFKLSLEIFLEENKENNTSHKIKYQRCSINGVNGFRLSASVNGEQYFQIKIDEEGSCDGYNGLYIYIFERPDISKSSTKYTYIVNDNNVYYSSNTKTETGTFII